MKKNKFVEVLLPALLIILIVWATDLFKEYQKPQASTGVEIESSIPVDDRFILEIPKISVAAPIIPDVPGSNKETYDKSLESGVAHFSGTGKPGEGRNIFIFGHSSNYFWAPGDYKDIFKNLDKLSVDDEITVLYQGKIYKYKVVEEKIVKPTQTDVLMDTGNGEQLTLMTCTPVGTSLNRLIIIAKPVN